MKAKSLKKLLVIKEICSWLPPAVGWMDGKFAANANGNVPGIRKLLVLT